MADTIKEVFFNEEDEFTPVTANIFDRIIGLFKNTSTWIILIIVVVLWFLFFR